MGKPVFKIENDVEIEITLDRNWETVPYAVNYPDKIVIYPNKLAMANAKLKKTGFPDEALKRIQKEKHK